jgi:5-bromo-4-chloroindolyl phosphate hydrolysis protein
VNGDDWAGHRLDGCILPPRTTRIQRQLDWVDFTASKNSKQLQESNITSLQDEVQNLQTQLDNKEQALLDKP